MKAALITEFAARSTLAIKQISPVTPGKQQVVVDVNYASVNPIDWKMQSALAYLPRNLFTPVILGRDFAGTVAAIGEKVKGFAVGDRVFGVSMNMMKGTFAEKAAVDANHLVKVPDNISLETAAALPTVGITVLQCFQKVDLRSGERLVIVGAAGGIGTVAVQIAKSMGVHVTAICSEKNRQRILSLGADRVIDYQQPYFLTQVGEADVVFDAAGTPGINQWKSVLSKQGRFITIGPDAKSTFALISHGVLLQKPSASFLSSRPNPTDLQEIIRLVEQQKLKPIIDSVFNFADINGAFARSRSKRAQGKILIRIMEEQRRS